MFRWTLTNNTTSEIYTLEHDPRGWDDLQLIHNRSEEYDGIFFDFSLSVAFGCKGSGKEFVDAAYDSLGSEADVSLRLQYTCEEDGQFKTLFTGQLNFSSYKIEYRSRQLYIVIDIEKTGITQQIKNREKTDVDLFATTSIGGTPLIPYSDLVLNMHSRSIYMKSNWIGDTHGCCTNRQSDDFFQVFLVPDLTLQKADFDKSFSTSSTCGMGAAFPASTAERLPNYFANAPAIIEVPSGGSVFTQVNTVNVAWSFTGVMTVRQQVFVAIGDCDTPECADANAQDPLGVGVNAITSAFLRLYFGDDRTTQPTAVDCALDPDLTSGLRFIDLISIPSHIWNTSIPTEMNPFTGSGTEQIPLREGEKIWIYWVFTGTQPPGLNYKITVEYSEATVLIDSNTVSESTTCKALAIHEAWSRLCEGITDKTLAFKSSLFGRSNSQGLSYPTDGTGSKTAITDGYRIRGFEQILVGAKVSEGQTKKGIITNLRDMYNSCNAVWGVGLGVEDHNGTEVIRVEEKTHFYNNNRILRLENVPDIQMEFLPDKAYSSVEIGYSKWRPDFKNGLDEPNAKCTWEFTKIKNFESKLSLLSKHVASMYAIETTRRKNVIFQTSDDTPYDDDIFFIALSNDDLTIPEKDENITVISGLIDSATAYNLRFNLFSNFDRLMNQFTGNLVKNQPQTINYSYFEGNGSMRFQYNSTGAIAGELNGEEVENIQNTTYPASRHRRGNPIIIPEQYSFTYPVSFTEYLNILADPYGFIEFSEGNTIFKQGYIRTFKYHLKKKIGEFTLIRKYG